MQSLWLKSNSLKKNNIYMVVVTEEMGVKKLLEITGILREIDGIMSLDYHIDENLVDTEEKKKLILEEPSLVEEV